LNNPNLQIFEDRIAAWDRTERAATFSSGMSAISTTILALLKHGDAMLSTAPIYGGTHHLLEHILPRLSIDARFVPAGDHVVEGLEAQAKALGEERIGLIFIETPSNPSLQHTDIHAVSRFARALEARTGKRVVVVVDNTLLGPVFQRPAEFGADLVLYSATKFLGGHSDLVAGVVSGRHDLMAEVLAMRTFLGTMTTPFNGWLLNRSLETVSVRMRRQSKSASALAKLLAEHPAVERVAHPSLLQPGTPQHAVFQQQCTGAGSLIAFEVRGGKDAAFEVLNRFEVFRLAVSLGGTESLAEHPFSMTHADVAPEENEASGVTPGLIRVSVGLEHLSDLRRDMEWALQSVPVGVGKS
ncbi:MAG: PLP-dependent transferase, partial [Planctomycetes bacterium]|nr:PLP-dependent transferase [Planctomycetota bacterium]